MNDAKIFVAGHNGMVGSAIVRRLEQLGCERLLLRGRAELDLLDQAQVREFFTEEKPEIVFLAAAKVGGIYANNTYPADFIHDNLVIASNIIGAAHAASVERLLFLGSSCIYPREAPQPMPEDSLLTGPLESTNEPYAIAKIAGIKLCESYNRQHGTDYRSVMPTNLYGSNDNFDLKTSHVLPALIRKFHEAKKSGASEVEVWGSGKPRNGRGCVHSGTRRDHQVGYELCGRHPAQPRLPRRHDAQAARCVEVAVTGVAGTDGPARRHRGHLRVVQRKRG
jgi:GDP-L-fucose synthase